MASKLSGIELTRYDDLFKTDEEREADREFEILLPDQSQSVGHVVAAASVLDAHVD